MTTISARCSREYLDILREEARFEKKGLWCPPTLRIDLQWRISNLWDKYLPIVLNELARDDEIKAYYLGIEHFPSESFDFTRKTMLYADKIIIEEPLSESHCATPFGHLIAESQELLKLEELVDEGIVSFLPGPLCWNRDIKGKLRQEATSDAEKIHQQKDVIKDVSQSELDRIRQEYPIAKNLSLQDYLRLKTEVVNSIMFAAARTKSQVSTDSEIRWKHLNWKIRSDSSMLKKLNLDMKILNALIHPNAKFMGDVPLSVVLEAREEGYLLGLRKTLRESFRDIYQSSDEEFEDTVRLWSDKLNHEIKTVEREFKMLRSWLAKRLKLRTGASLIAGGVFMCVSSIAPIPALIGMASSMLGIGSLSATDILEWREKKEELKRKPIYLFLKSHGARRGKKKSNER